MLHDHRHHRNRLEEQDLKGKFLDPLFLHPFSLFLFFFRCLRCFRSFCEGTPWIDDNAPDQGTSARQGRRFGQGPLQPAVPLARGEA